VTLSFSSVMRAVFPFWKNRYQGRITGLLLRNLRPENVPLLVAPKVNPEVADMLPDPAKAAVLHQEVLAVISTGLTRGSTNKTKN